MSSFTLSLRHAAAFATALGLSMPAAAAPITVSNAGYFLDRVGTNTVGIAGGGSPAGSVRAQLVADTSPNASAGTMASANYSGAPGPAPGVFDQQWYINLPNPTAAQLAPLTIVFTNGADQASFAGRSLAGLTQLPLVQNLALSGGSGLSPTFSWVLPTAQAAGDVDLIRLYFYANANNGTEVAYGSPVDLPATATSYTLTAPLPAGFNLTFSVRLLDLFDDNLAPTLDNVQRQSRTFVNYAAVVPEPGTWALWCGGLAWVLAARRRGLLSRRSL